ncbi:MAG: DUF542 domain-containing protein [Candidatus Tectomicrobia bacterium]|uniref:DUF542 domain-containing protein n=1 Tax=Tectimicrobiota bacterium TaxID=2528274 RepID=A0A932CNG2_UNCTE|nr:DUF542 domain-containing protein [Candidatus Tectomicrobia bacterium]
MITKEMIIREVIRKYPATINIFGKFQVDFCCGGSHSIERTAQACGVRDVPALLAELNRVVDEGASRSA